jgi:hypothetical protein
MAFMRVSTSVPKSTSRAALLGTLEVVLLEVVLAGTKVGELFGTLQSDSVLGMVFGEAKFGELFGTLQSGSVLMGGLRE